MNIHFKETLQRIEIAAGIKTMTELAKVVGTSQQYVSKKSKEGEFPINWAYEVAKKFNISTDWIMTGEGPTRKNEATEINPLLVEVNEWLNEGRKHENAEFKILFEQQMIRAFFDYEEWKRKRDFKESGKSKFPASKVA